MKSTVTPPLLKGATAKNLYSHFHSHSWWLYKITREGPKTPVQKSAQKPVFSPILGHFLHKKGPQNPQIAPFNIPPRHCGEISVTQPQTKSPPDFREELIIGPPGTGKTTELGRQIRLSTEDAKTVLVCSLTRASAAEIAGRDLPIPYEAVGTLHSHCFHALGQPLIAEDKTHIEDWNAQYPALALTTSASDRAKSLDEDNLDPATDQSPGDDLMSRYQIMRSRMTKPQPGTDIEQFANLWTEWKRHNGLIDFTDLIETCLDEVDIAPGAPDVIYVDEAQDLDLLEMALIRKWANAAGHMVAVGDPDQAIYIWRGADPGAFSTPQTDTSTTHILEQSYRIPKSVHRHAVAWIDQTPDRSPITYYPTDTQGDFKRIQASYKFPEQALIDAEDHIQNGKTVMFLATCSYMLNNLVAALKRTGTPFWNPHRRANGAWNPLQRRANSTTAADRILAYLALSETSYWTAEDIYRWTNALKLDAVISSGGRQRIKNLTDDDEGSVSIDEMTQLLTPEAMDASLSGDLDWYELQLLASKRQPALFPLAIAKRCGPEALRQSPQLVVGTIHSTKGSEADVVYIFPDISRAGMTEWLGDPAQRASVFRLFYVGMTRAKETLVVCNPATRGSSSCTTWYTWGRVIRGIFSPPILLQGQQECPSQQAHGNGMMPAGPGARFVLVQPHVALLSLEFGLNAPSGTAHPDQGLQGSVFRSVGQIVSGLTVVQVPPVNRPEDFAGLPPSGRPHPLRTEPVVAGPWLPWATVISRQASSGMAPARSCIVRRCPLTSLGLRGAPRPWYGGLVRSGSGGHTVKPAGTYST